MEKDDKQLLEEVRDIKRSVQQIGMIFNLALGIGIVVFAKALLNRPI